MSEMQDELCKVLILWQMKNKECFHHTSVLYVVDWTGFWGRILVDALCVIEGLLVGPCMSTFRFDAMDLNQQTSASQLDPRMS